MDYKEFQKEQIEAFKFLDTIDIDKYLVNDEEIYDVRDKIEEDYKGKYNKGLIFNCISIDEFMNYILKRYSNIIFREVINNYVYRVED